VLLPIIVFNEGYSMNKHHFFKNFFYVILYGVIATFFNFILVTLFSLLLVDAGRNIHPGGNLSELSTYSVIFYAACISSKDSGLVLTLLNFKKRPKLYSILFGERILFIIRFQEILNDLIVFSLQKAVN
jgi:sodium/hydrogen exchanger-like protein 6/7/sodium/hydrogen exchanger 8